MNKSASPKRFNLQQLTARYRNRPGWQRWTVEIALMLVLFSLISSWTSRHLLQEGTALPPLHLTTLSGEPVTLAEHSQNRTLIYVFAPWCSICRISMPGLDLIDRPNLEQVAVALDYQSVAEVEKFIEDVGFSGRVLLGDSSAAQALKIQGYPSYYLLDEAGDIIHRSQGLTTPPGIWLNSL